jgi:phage head maturation protease
MSDRLTDILFRGQFDRGVELRAEDDDTDESTTMEGLFARYDQWYEIDSWIEGNFLERFVMGSFKDTIREHRDSIKIAFDHGYDPQIGDKPLGPIEELRETDEGPYYAVPLLDTDYNRGFVLPALRGQTMDGRRLGSVLGASHRFTIRREEWVNEPKRSDYNPKGIPERTIRTVGRLYEFGPVVYPANPGATAGMRCLTDYYHDRHRERAERSGRPISSPAGSGPDVHTNGPVVSDPPEDTPTRTNAADIAAFTARLRVGARS